MDIGDRHELAAALSRIQARTGLTLDEQLLEAYLGGALPAASVDDALEDAEVAILPLQRYFMVAEAYRRQEDLDLRYFYDLTAASRVVPMLRFLDEALAGLADGTGGLEPRLQAIRAPTTLAALEAAIYELVVANRYRDSLKAAIEFPVPTAGRRSPDILATLPTGRVVAVECKKYDKLGEQARELRDTLRPLLLPVLGRFQQSGESVLVDLRLREWPVSATSDEIANAALASFSEGGFQIVERTFTVAARRTSEPDNSQVWLYPSPKYFHEQYGWRIGGEWHGIVNAIRARKLGPSFITDISWEGAVRWQLDDPLSLWRQRKLNFKTILDGIRQLEGWGDYRGIHVGYDRNPAIGHRQESLLKFWERLRGRNEIDKAIIGLDFVVFNETSSLASPLGSLDFQEYSYSMSRGPRPPVESAWTVGGSYSRDLSLFGIGETLPPLD